MSRFRKITQRLRRIFRPRNLLIAAASTFLLFLLLDWVYPLPPAKTYSPVVYARDGQLLSAALTPDDKWRLQALPDEVEPDLITALLEKEDRWFYWHPGVNPFAVVRAAWNNFSTGKRTSGASTITMQVARMLQPKARTLPNKSKEVFRALQLEWHHSKAEILSMYLSYLPYGGNIEGVNAASYLYFDRSPAQLSLSQVTLLATIPNRPNSLRMDTRKTNAKATRDQWLLRFQNRGTFPKADIQAALLEPITAQRTQFNSRAPHLSRYLINQSPTSRITSTIDPEIQETSEALLGNYIRRARSKGISNGAVLVVDNATAEVLAYCGSADFNDTDASGQVDGIRAIRSPGSTLKPIAYAMAFDRGHYTPDTRLLDVPTNWNGYAPQNYDLTFRGAVTVREALRHSLNITAVNTLDLVGFEKFIQLMETAGFKTIAKQREKLGLSVILGGCGVTLEELTRTFAAFANGGRVRPLQYQMSEDTALQGHPLFSEASAWLIQDILSGIERPDIPSDLAKATNRANIAWKTGTSYGRRDAWSIGFTPRYTIGVWAGNFNGQGVPDLSGSSIAVPLLFDLFGALEKGKTKQEFQRPEMVWRRETCQETGALPSEHCNQVRKGYYIRNISPRTICSQDQTLYIAPDSSLQFCTACLPPKNYTKATYSILPARLTLFYEENKLHYPRPPRHNPACSATFDGPGPEINHPEKDYEYLLEKGAEQEILLQAASDTRVNRHYWYIEGKFHRSCAPGERIFFTPEKTGDIRITCMDDRGRSQETTIHVSWY